jgi:SAM-dependent methyltransferase
VSPAPQDAEERRARMLDAWERASAGWGRQADRVRDSGMPVSAWMIERAELQAGQRVLELAAGPGDTGFLAAELISPGGVLICSDATAGMLEVARERAREIGLRDVEFKQLQLEWIDLAAASVDVIMCRWGLMLCLDPAAALHECRRVVRPGGRIVLAVWDDPAANPAMSTPGAALAELGLVEPAPSGGPGPFALSAPGRLQELLEDAGFVDAIVEPIEIARRYDSVREWIGESLDLSMAFGAAWRELDGEARGRLSAELERRTLPFRTPDGGLILPGRSLGASAEA